MRSFLSRDRIELGPWYSFERLIQRLLVHSGFTNVTHTGKSNDRGADITGIDKRGNRVIVQCKFTIGAGSIGSKAVDELRNACDWYGTSFGIIVTNTGLSRSCLARINELSEGGYSFVYWDYNQLVKWGQSLDDKASSWLKPRDYQEDAVDAVLQEFSKGKRALVEMATGLGKTIVMAEVATRFIREDPSRRVLLLAHSLPLLNQLESSIWSQIGASVPTQLWRGGQRPPDFEGITVGMFQSIDTFLRNSSADNDIPTFDLVMVDEAHHTPAVSFSRVLEEMGKDKVLGVTATPWRGDGARIEAIFGEPVFKMGILEGIERGFLSDIEYKMYLDDVNWLQVASCSEKNLTISDLNSRLFIPGRDEVMVDSILREWRERGKPKMLVFCKQEIHAKNLQALLNGVGIPSKVLVSRDTPMAERTRTLMGFRSSDFSNLVVVDLLNEGVDVPDVSMIVFARVTHSRRIFVQQLGRGLRVTDEKERLFVMDFVADIRRVAEGASLNQIARTRMADGVEFYKGRGAEIVNFGEVRHEGFVSEFLADAADLDDHERVQLNFM